MIKWGFFISAYVLAITIGCKSIDTYPDTSTPIYISNDHESTINADSSLTVITFNITTGTSVSEVLKAIENDKDFLSTDILLLQEVNEDQVKAIARAFQLNYVYYPISKSREDINFGNAILARTKINKPNKLILPHSKINGRIRNATNCQLEINGKELLVYSIHNETMIMSNRKRRDQLNAILQDILSKSVEPDAIIIGGDFNYICKKNLQKEMEAFELIGFDWITKEIGSTKNTKFIIKGSLDHFAIKNLEPSGIKTLKDMTISDHHPVMITIQND